MNVARAGNTIDGKANATITRGMALKLVENSSEIEFTPCTADTDLLVGFALNDASATETVLVQTDGNIEFIAGEALDANTDKGKRLTCGAGGAMFLAGAAKMHWLQFLPTGRNMVRANGDVAINKFAMGKYCTGTTAA